MVETSTDTDGEGDDDHGVSYGVSSKGPDREDMVSEYLPAKEDWTSKTVLDLNDPGRVAVLRNIDKLFPECEHHQEVIDVFLDQFLRGRTSIDGRSREEYNRIFESMYGGTGDDSKGSMLSQALAEDIRDDD